MSPPAMLSPPHIPTHPHAPKNFPLGRESISGGYAPKPPKQLPRKAENQNPENQNY